MWGSGQRDIAAMRAACVALCLITLGLLSPGLVGPDEADMLRQAEAGAFHDWHSPLIAWIWRAGLWVWPGTGSIHAIITLTFFVGIGLLSEALLRHGHRVAGWILVALSALPLTWIALAAAGSKDVLTSALMLVAVGLVARRPERPRLAGSAAVLVLLLAMQVRPNAAFAAAPLLALIAWRWMGATPRALRIAITSGVAILSVPVLLVSAMLLREAAGVQRSHVAAGLFLFDLAGISAITGEDASPGLLGEGFAREAPACYTPLHWDTYAPWGRCPQTWQRLFGDSLFFEPDDRGEERRLRAAWLKAILQSPIAYARHRLTHFAYETGLGAEPLGKMSWVDAPVLGRPLLAAIDGTAENLASLPLLQPFAVLLAGGIGFALCLRRHSFAAALGATLFASATLYGLAYLIVGVASNFRYFHWPILAVATGCVWLAVAFTARRRLPLLSDPAACRVQPGAAQSGQAPPAE